MNKAVGIGIGIAVVAIAAVFAYSYSTPESQPQEESVVIQDEATVEVGVTPGGKSVSLSVEEKIGVGEEIPP